MLLNMLGNERQLYLLTTDYIDLLVSFISIHSSIPNLGTISLLMVHWMPSQLHTISRIVESVTFIFVKEITLVYFQIF